MTYKLGLINSEPLSLLSMHLLKCIHLTKVVFSQVPECIIKMAEMLLLKTLKRQKYCFPSNLHLVY